jgi:hypothetical protein
MAREYNWNVKSKASKGYEENFFFLFRDEGVYYNELETRVRLSKRRLKAGQHIGNSKLVVKHRPLNKQESKMQRYRCVFVTICPWLRRKVNRYLYFSSILLAVAVYSKIGMSMYSIPELTQVP